MGDFWDKNVHSLVLASLGKNKENKSSGLTYATDVGRRFGTLIIDMLLLENPQFLPNNYETLPKCPTHE